MAERTHEPLAPVELVHIAPLPPGHRQAADCWCAPIASSRLGFSAQLIVHRTADLPLDLREARHGE